MFTLLVMPYFNGSTKRKVQALAICLVLDMGALITIINF